MEEKQEVVTLIKRSMPRTVTTKHGEAKTIGIQVEEYPDEWLNGFAPFNYDNWIAGVKIPLVVWRDPQYGLKFKVPKERKTNTETQDAVTQLFKEIENLKKEIDELKKYIKPNYNEDVPF